MKKVRKKQARTSSISNSSWRFSRLGGWKKKNTPFRSGGEENFKRYLDSKKVKYSYETLKIGYVPKPKKYTPDFILANGIVIEYKGRFLPEDRSKHLLVKEQHPELDIRFVFEQNHKLNKKSKTRYSDWCDKHGFKYIIAKRVDGKLTYDIPEDWIQTE